MRRFIAVALVAAILLVPSAAFGKVWSVSAQRKTLTAACVRFGVTGSARAWVVRAGIKCIHGESRGNDKCRTGKHVGILQFTPGWAKPSGRHGWAPGHSHKDWRTCGACSIYRFVRVYRDGGKRAIRRHWRATVGGL